MDLRVHRSHDITSYEAREVLFMPNNPGRDIAHGGTGIKPIARVVVEEKGIIFVRVW
jgi:hypothetical protein